MIDKRELLLACRYLARSGLGDSIFGHISAIDRESQTILIKPTTVGFDEIKEEEFVTIDLDGKKKSGRDSPPGESAIHTEIYRANKEVGSIVHVHAFNAAVLGAMTKTVEAYTQNSVIFSGARIYDDARLITEAQTARKLVRVLGNNPGTILRSHGIVCVGPRIQEACIRAAWLEEAATAQNLSFSSKSRPMNLAERKSLGQVVARKERYDRIWSYIERSVS